MQVEEEKPQGPACFQKVCWGLGAAHAGGRAGPQVVQDASPPSVRVSSSGFLMYGDIFVVLLKGHCVILVEVCKNVRVCKVKRCKNFH